MARAAVVDDPADPDARRANARIWINSSESGDVVASKALAAIRSLVD